jgi:isoleucyl-tRNA synthetase
MYCSGKNSQLRKSAQTALFQLLKTTLILMAPILPFTTEETWESMPDYKDKLESVHLELFPDFKEAWLDEASYKEWEEIVQIRELVLKELELAREKKLIGNSLEAAVVLHLPPAQKKMLENFQDQISSLFIVSSVVTDEARDDDLRIEITKVEWKKCLRCWNYSEYVGTNDNYPDFCRRCQDVVEKIDS